MPGKKSELEKHGVTVPMVWLIGAVVTFAGWITIMHFHDRSEMKDRISAARSAINSRIETHVGNLYEKINEHREDTNKSFAEQSKLIADETVRSTVVDNTQDKLQTKMWDKLEDTSRVANRTAAEAGIRHNRRMGREQHHQDAH